MEEYFKVGDIVLVTDENPFENSSGVHVVGMIGRIVRDNHRKDSFQWGVQFKKH